MPRPPPRRSARSPAPRNSGGSAAARQRLRGPFRAAPVPALHHSKEGRMARSSRESAVKSRPASTGGGNGKTLRNGKSAADARKDLLERAGRNRDGASQWRSDPLEDAQAARRVADLAQAHAPELSRRGLTSAYNEAARRLADEIEDHLQALPAAAVTARGRSTEQAELLADAAATATLAFAGDPEERARLLSLLPRADERRHLRRSADEIPAA